jgi:hypothetical protein
MAYAKPVPRLSLSLSLSLPLSLFLFLFLSLSIAPLIWNPFRFPLSSIFHCSFLFPFQSLSEEEAYKLSMKIEPRNPSEAIEVMLIKEDQQRRALEELQVYSFASLCYFVLSHFSSFLSGKFYSLDFIFLRFELHSWKKRTKD